MVLSDFDASTTAQRYFVNRLEATINPVGNTPDSRFPLLVYSLNHEIGQLTDFIQAIALASVGIHHDSIATDANPIGILKNRLEFLMVISDFFFPVHPFDVSRYIFHRARAVE